MSREGTREPLVFISAHEATCNECKAELRRGAWITLNGERGALCLSCSDLDHLVFLPSGNTALTRRARKHSTLSVVVLKWSRHRKRNERQGVLVEETALELAERECLEDADVRARRREREAARREELDIRFVQQFAQRILEIFPNCPSGTNQAIAEHACLKYSGRVGRSAAAKALEEEVVRLAVIAHVRHAETNYDSLLAMQWNRSEARAKVRGRVSDILSSWR